MPEEVEQMRGNHDVRVSTFFNSVKGVQYRSGSPEYLNYGDCQDLLAWFVNDALGWKEDWIKENSISMMLKMVERYNRFYNLAFEGDRWKWYGSRLTDWSFAHPVGLTDLREPCAVWFAKGSSAGIARRHIMLVLPGEISGAVTGLQRSPDEYLRYWSVIDLSSDGLYIGSFLERFNYFVRRMSSLPGRWDTIQLTPSGPIVEENAFATPNAVVCPLFGGRRPHIVL
jgi:hypothetical protein